MKRKRKMKPIVALMMQGMAGNYMFTFSRKELKACNWPLTKSFQVEIKPIGELI